MTVVATHAFFGIVLQKGANRNLATRCGPRNSSSVPSVIHQSPAVIAPKRARADLVVVDFEAFWQQVSPQGNVEYDVSLPQIFFGQGEASGSSQARHGDEMESLRFLVLCL